MHLVRQRYLDNYRDHLECWERGRVTDIVCALNKLGRTPLGRAGNHAFRVIRSIERMIDNLAYPDGPDLAHEQARASTYNYIFAAPYDRRFAALTPEELCYRLREAGVSEMDMQAQSYEQILSGRPASLYRLVPLNEGKGYAFRPICSCSLSVGPDGTFPLQTDLSRKQDALLDKRHYSIAPKPSKPTGQKKASAKSLKKKPQGVKRSK